MNDKIEKELWRRVRRYCRFLQMVPFLRMAAVCNNLAFGKVDKESDIDLFIIAKKGRLFFVRTFVTFLFQLMGVRRHGEKVAGRFCLSFFVDEECLDLSRIAIEDDIYLALWVYSMVPVFDDGVSSHFFSQNLWIRRYLIDKKMVFDKKKLPGKNLSSSRFLGGLRKILGWFFNGVLGNLVEGVLMRWQLVRARRKMGAVSDGASLIVEKHILKFHNIDRRAYYRDLWHDKYGSFENVDLERFCLL